MIDFDDEFRWYDRLAILAIMVAVLAVVYTTWPSSAGQGVWVAADHIYPNPCSLSGSRVELCPQFFRVGLPTP